MLPCRSATVFARSPVRPLCFVGGAYSWGPGQGHSLGLQGHGGLPQHQESVHEWAKDCYCLFLQSPCGAFPLLRCLCQAGKHRAAGGGQGVLTYLYHFPEACQSTLRCRAVCISQAPCCAVLGSSIGQCLSVRL